MKSAYSRVSKFGQLTAVIRHEVTSYIRLPLSWIFLTGFLLALSACVWLVNDTYRSDQATVSPLFVYLPWVALIFVPALAMRCWPIDGQNRQVELMTSLPVAPPTVILGKFIAGSLVLLAGLAFTFPFPVTVAYLGNPDAGIVISSYLGGALILPALFSVALFSTVLVREQAGSFVTGAALIFVLLAVGWEVTTSLAVSVLNLQVIDVIQRLSPVYWISVMMSGTVKFSSVLYFCTLTGTFLLATVGVAQWQIGQRFGWTFLSVLILIPATGFLLAPKLEYSIGFLDLTEEKEYTLSPTTLDILNSLPDGMEVDFYWSVDNEQIPASTRNYFNRVDSLLELIQSRSGGKLSLNRITPSPDTEQELVALQSGIQKVALSSGSSFYFGAAFSDGHKTHRIPYFDLSRDRYLEYDIAVILAGFATDGLPKLGLLSPFVAPRAIMEGQQGLSIISELQNSYDVAIIPFFSETLPGNLDALILINAQVLRKSLLREIDQFLFNGGSLIVLLDPFSRLNLQGNSVNSGISDEINDISDLLARYGILYEDTYVVGDSSLGFTMSGPDGELVRYPFWVRFEGKSDGGEHVLSSLASDVLLAESGSLQLTDGTGTSSLLETSDRSGVFEKEEFSSESLDRLIRRFESDGQSRVVAAIRQGRIESAYSNTQLNVDSAADRESTLIVVADTDWIFDDYSVEIRNFGDYQTAVPVNGNRQWILDMVEHSTGGFELSKISSRGRSNRRFERVAEIVAEVETEIAGAQSVQQQKIVDYELQIEQLIGSSGAVSISEIPQPVAEQIAQIQIAMLPVRAKLRQIRRQVREEVDSLGNRLVLGNLLSGPIMVIIFFLLCRFARRRKQDAFN